MSTRGPLLIIDGERDNTVPLTLARAAFKLQKKNSGITEFEVAPNRGHSLVIDSGWREVAETALAFLQRFNPSA
jgi:pimeloyl-ACP methyl ester carboxylesterase